jgi:hypothetical protein
MQLGNTAGVLFACSANRTFLDIRQAGEYSLTLRKKMQQLISGICINKSKKGSVK